MMPRRFGMFAALAVTAAVLVLGAVPALARPLYFDNFTALYGFGPGDDLYACGVCHRNWAGTGARNQYGSAIEQQLYIGKTILDAMQFVELDDADGDGFSNVDELTVHGTLPGYSCGNFEDAIDPPANFQSLITPMVASCLEPKDIKVDPPAINFVTEVDAQDSATVTIFNNGTDFPITVSSAALLPGPASITATGPVPPIVIPVGGSATIDVTFAPTVSLNVAATLRIDSDDPDEPTIDVPISGLGIILPLAPADARSACLSRIDKQMRKYTKAHTNEWARCFADEVRGRACDTGRRELKIQKAEAALRAFVGGDKDRECAANSLSPVLLGLSPACPAPCDGITATNIDGLVDCLVCTQEASTATLLTEGFGVMPPDLPPSVPSSAAASCQKSIGSAMSKGVQKVQKILARCELENIGAASAVVCVSAHGAELTEIGAGVDSAAARCADTSGLQSCVFQMGADPTCLGDTAVSLGSAIVGLTFGVP
jgi:hypothetical protein